MSIKTTFKISIEQQILGEPVQVIYAGTATVVSGGLDDDGFTSLPDEVYFEEITRAVTALGVEPNDDQFLFSTLDDSSLRKVKLSNWQSLYDLLSQAAIDAACTLATGKKSPTSIAREVDFSESLLQKYAHAG